MGRGFGRGAKSVAIVTHAQVKNAKKVPRGLKITRKKRRQQYKDAEADEDPNRMLDTGNSGARKGGGNRAPKTLEQQIAGVDFQLTVARGKGKLKDLRRNIVSQVKNLRRKHHAKQEARSKVEVKRVEQQMAKQRRLAEEKLAAEQKAAAEAKRLLEKQQQKKAKKGSSKKSASVGGKKKKSSKTE